MRMRRFGDQGGERCPILKDAFDDFLGAFGAFREANDERLAELERKLSADVVTEEKVERINTALDSQKRMLDRLLLKGSRPDLWFAWVGTGA